MFDYKKHYVFSLDKFILDRAFNGAYGDDVKRECELWAKEIDGKPVIYVSERVGVCGMFVVHPDWCIEVDPYTMKEVE